MLWLRLQLWVRAQHSQCVWACGGSGQVLFVRMRALHETLGLCKQCSLGPMHAGAGVAAVLLVSFT
jgi:hypothetical protein